MRRVQFRNVDLNIPHVIVVGSEASPWPLKRFVEDVFLPRRLSLGGHVEGKLMLLFGTAPIRW